MLNTVLQIGHYFKIALGLEYIFRIGAEAKGHLFQTIELGVHCVSSSAAKSLRPVSNGIVFKCPGILSDITRISIRPVVTRLPVPAARMPSPGASRPGVRGCRVRA